MPSSITWPSELSGSEGQLLPYALREGYGYQQRSGAQLTSFGMVDRARRIFRDAPVDFDRVSWLMTFDEKGYFEGWFWSPQGLDAGTRAFQMPLQVNGALELREVSFNGRVPAYDLVGVSHWRVSGSLTTLAGLQPDAEAFAGFVAEDDFLIE